MNNPFENKTDEELKIMFNQYKQFQKTGIIPNNELGEIRDFLIREVTSSGWHILMMQYLLEVIGERWIN